MKKRRLMWHLYPSYLFVVILALLVVTWFSTTSLREFYKKQIMYDLDFQGRLLADLIEPMLISGQYPEIDQLCKSLPRSNETRVTVILPSGKVIADSDEDPVLMENHKDRPEIIEAYQGKTGTSERYSHTIDKHMMYLAMPLSSEGKTIAVIRTSLPMSSIQTALEHIYRHILLAGLLTAAGIAGLCLLLSRRISRPLEDMKQVAEQFAQGKLVARMRVPGTLELATLAESLHEMARELQDRIQTITNERNKLEAILSSMKEGVIAIDLRGHIVSINQAAIFLLNISESSQPGCNIEEVVRNSDFQDFVEISLQSEAVEETEIHLHTFKERYLRLQSASLYDAQERKSGVVIVVYDMTQLRHLENVRRDFVANVSHELKTPVTSIKGFVETLQDGALQDPEQAEHFLQIVSKHTERLNAIIEDLLSLAWLEDHQDLRAENFEVEKLRPILVNVMDLMRPKADKNQVTMDLSCDNDIGIRVNPALFEQAMINLVDNAIKYSPEKGNIRIEVHSNKESIDISVIDNGSGIAQKHLDRIFERFYVVDKARSRKLGGTGLGLSIVKHIIQTHGGSVSVSSELGKGSIFTIHLPKV